jgi:hypothetical protein
MSYKLNNTINGFSIVDPESKRPFYPLFFVSHSISDSNLIAQEILNSINSNKDLSKFQIYKTKNNES